MIPSLSPTQRSHRSDLRRRKILAAALGCFLRRGFEATSIADIRKVSGASVGSIYHHFGGKEALAAALYLELMQSYQRSLEAAIGGRRCARTLVFAIVGHHLRWAEAHPDWARYLHEMRGHEQVQAREGEIQQLNRALLGRILHRLHEYREAGELRPLTTALFFPLIVAPLNEMVRSWLEHPQQIDLRACRRPLMEAVWRSVGRETKLSPPGP